MKNKQYYLQVLGLGEDASLEDIKKMYRELAKILHPDRHNNSEIAKRKFQELNDAYEFLVSEYEDSPQQSVNKSSPVDLDRWENRLFQRYLFSLLLLVGVSGFFLRDQLLQSVKGVRFLGSNKSTGEKSIPTEVKFNFSGCQEMLITELGSKPIYYSSPSRKVTCSFDEKYNAFDFSYSCVEDRVDGSPVTDYGMSWVRGWRVPKMDNHPRFLAGTERSEYQKLNRQIECDAETGNCKYLYIIRTGDSTSCSGTFSGSKYRDLSGEWDAMDIKTKKDDEGRWRGALRMIPSKFHGTYRAYARADFDYEPKLYEKGENYLLEISATKIISKFDFSRKTGSKGCEKHLIYGGVRSIESELRPEFLQMSFTSRCPGGAQQGPEDKEGVKTYCLSFEGKYLIQRECSPECRNPLKKTAFANCKKPKTEYFERIGQ